MTAMATSEGLLEWLRGACKGPLLRYRIDVEPLPTPRPRVPKFGSAYYPPRYEEYRAEVQKQLARQIADQATKDARAAGLLDGRLAVVIEVACARPRTGKLADPRGDVDNYAKGPLDACTKVGLWRDDAQVAALGVTKRYAQGPAKRDAQRDQEADEAPGINLWVGSLA